MGGAQSIEGPPAEVQDEPPLPPDVATAAIAAALDGMPSADVSDLYALHSSYPKITWERLPPPAQLRVIRSVDPPAQARLEHKQLRMHVPDPDSDPETEAAYIVHDIWVHAMQKGFSALVDYTETHVDSDAWASSMADAPSAKSDTEAWVKAARAALEEFDARPLGHAWLAPLKDIRPLLLVWPSNGPHAVSGKVHALMADVLTPPALPLDDDL